MSYRITWDNIGPEPELGKYEDGLSYTEAVSLKELLTDNIDVVNIQIRKEKRYAQYKQIRHTGHARRTAI